MEDFIKQVTPKMPFMKAAVVYFSRTGNTKKLAEDIAHALQAPIFDVAATSPSDIAEFDLIVFGTPVEGASPTKEAAAFLSAMREVSNKKAIVFNTCRLFGNSRTNKALEKALKAKGYETVLAVSKKVKSTEQLDYTDIVAEVKAAVSKLTENA
jgi:flavodoxin